MTPEEMIAEGEALSRICFHLSDDPVGEVVGYWGGERADITEETFGTMFQSCEHLFTVNERLLAKLGIDHIGPVGLFELEDMKNDFHLQVRKDYRESFDSVVCNGVPLYATEKKSFPPFEALCLYGSEKIGQWLQSLGLKRYEHWKIPEETYAAYHEHYLTEYPLWMQDVDVIVGGWHLRWPDDAYYMPAEVICLFLTLRDAEPWYSVWYSPSGKGCFSKSHIT